ncbi:uncharacterized protein MONOS_1072 [Monocercomonoides exilis]|uniref:uncharacterized protein n=1 Tax=Monocercomonoides exilis TaxID=2049356 RepID=UPI00355A97B8|nr:hypothetical protein MONOS_1072 [Monocercomonoides exilis]|eukprot:MONOS_1072.1-p1 / transcript=MONOS_1072.1 / gene=MONOS_1072 / organism=Monocercomonoides_exilis_PA203 / gene_product=unspecified product / transcript_product=unspecified product / location=Mono_scaffold00018:95188-96405(-) / protein_length=406 / sequence_SO=supercontig / SO=protein_coding / is_pseudo=false
MLLEESAIAQLISSILDGSSALASFALGTATLLHIQQFAVFLGNMLARLMDKLQLCQASLTMKTAMPSGGLSLQRLMTTFALLIRTHHKYHCIIPPELYFPSFASPNSEVYSSCLSYAQYLHLNRSDKISDGNALPLLPLLAFMNTIFVFMEKKSQKADGIVAEELQKQEILLKEYFGYVSAGKKTGHRLIPFLWEKTLFYGLSNEDAQSSQTENHAPETLAIVNDFEIRNMIFEFISTLCHGSKVNQGCVFELLGKLQQLEDEHVYPGFNISALPLVSPWSRERSKYRGIHNPNAMSHIISIFAQLYMHPQFRSTFLMWDGQSEFPQNKKEQMVVSPPAEIVEQQLRRMRGMNPIFDMEEEDMMRKRITSSTKEEKEECENIWNTVRLLFAELRTIRSTIPQLR